MPRLSAWLRQFAIICTALGSPAAGEPLTTCQVLADLADLHGKVVTVRSQLKSGLGVWLTAEGCRRPVVVQGYRFDNLIAVEWSDAPIVKRELPERNLFPPDMEGARLLESAIRRESKGTSFTTVIEGMIVTKLPLDRLVRHGVPMTPRGYGHLGVAPAMIVVKRIVSLAEPEGSKP